MYESPEQKKDWRLLETNRKEGFFRKEVNKEGEGNTNKGNEINLG
jgi:hypothetical protein